jgi:hypothetical protein
MTTMDRRGALSSRVLAAALVVCLAALLPYASTLNNYFVRDDFGVVELLASKPASYFPRWFYTPWTDRIWGDIADEVRPFMAVSYQITALGGAASPFLHHAMNVALHAATGLLVLVMARWLAGLSLTSSVFAATVFVLLPVQAETVAWITGRVDSMPALFYIAAFVAYARWREKGATDSRLYVGSLALFFAALFTKQTTITMVATLVAWDVLLSNRPARPTWSWVRPYVPFVLMTMAYMWLRYVLFGQVAREGQLNSEGLHYFFVLIERHLARVVTGNVNAGAVVTWGVLAATTVLGWWLARHRIAGERRRLARVVLFFGPLWWAIGVLPIAVAGYESPRHVYLASAGWAIVLGVVFDLAWTGAIGVARRRAVLAVASAVVIFYSTGLYKEVTTWNTLAKVSRKVLLDTRAEALSAPPGSLIVIGAPKLSWEWAMPFPLKPPYTRVDLTTRVFLISPWLLHCCRNQWVDDTRRILQTWQDQHTGAPVIVLRWDGDTGALSRITDREYPALRSLVPVLLQVRSRDALSAAVLKIVDDLPVPTGR